MVQLENHWVFFGWTNPRCKHKKNLGKKTCWKMVWSKRITLENRCDELSVVVWLFLFVFGQFQVAFFLVCLRKLCDKRWDLMAWHPSKHLCFLSWELPPQNTSSSFAKRHFWSWCSWNLQGHQKMCVDYSWWWIWMRIRWYKMYHDSFRRF